MKNYKQTALSFLGDFSFPITEKIRNEILSLSISPAMADGEVSFLIETLNRF